MRPRRIRPRQLFLAFAQSVAVTWTLLIVGVALTIAHDKPNVGIGVLLLVHGLALLGHVLASLALWVNHRWSRGVLARALVAGAVPYATLWFEVWAEQRHLLADAWRLGDVDSTPGPRRERVLQWVLSRPSTALVAGALGIAGLGTALLDAGFRVTWMMGGDFW